VVELLAVVVPLVVLAGSVAFVVVAALVLPLVASLEVGGASVVDVPVLEPVVPAVPAVPSVPLAGSLVGAVVCVSEALARAPSSPQATSRADARRAGAVRIIGPRAA
jgi:hypothetical protein